MFTASTVYKNGSQHCFYFWFRFLKLKTGIRLCKKQESHTDIQTTEITIFIWEKRGCYEFLTMLSIFNKTDLVLQKPIVIFMFYIYFVIYKLYYWRSIGWLEFRWSELLSVCNTTCVLRTHGSREWVNICYISLFQYWIAVTVCYIRKRERERKNG